MHMRIVAKHILLAAGFVVAAGVARPASAQTAACVYLQPGAGYAGQMRLTWGKDSVTPWTSTFAIGKHGCQTLAGNVPVGGIYNVQIKARAGNTKTCTPAALIYDPNFKANNVYNAWGTTLSVKCEQVN